MTGHHRDWQWPPLTQPVNILDWNNFCIRYSVKNRQMKLVHNGVVEVNHIRPQEVANIEDYLPSEWFGPNLDGTKTKNKTNVSKAEAIVFVVVFKDFQCLSHNRKVQL